MLNLFKENCKIALKAIKSQLIRTFITITIIAIGISALVGILTAIDAIQYAISNNFSRMGANTFSISSQGNRLQHSRRGEKSETFPAITYREAMALKNTYAYNALCAVSYTASSGATMRYKNTTTDPNISISAADENYVAVSGLEIEIGRDFSQSDIQLSSNNIILGNEVYKKLFQNGINPIGEKVKLNNQSFKIIGVLAEKGSSMGFSGDRSCLIPISNARIHYSAMNGFKIDIKAYENSQMNAAIDMAINQFRVIRKLAPGRENNFNISKSDELATTFIENITSIKSATTFIGFTTLLGAAIALMNIMLVSVTERTREIGIRKAIGANAKTIREQFLIEAIIICQIGGILGIIGGILLGNIVSIILGSAFFIPWVWISSGIVLCIVVGLVAGLYPAVKASKLDPIESLRYE